MPMQLFMPGDVNVAPQEKGTFFNGELTDGDGVTRIVGFDKAQQQKLETFCAQKTPVLHCNCEVKQQIQQTRSSLAKLHKN